MGIQIEDGGGSGETAFVDDNRLRVLAVASSLTNHISIEPANQTVFTVFGTATPVVGIAPVLFVQNNDPTLLMILDRIFVQGVGVGGALPLATQFFSLGFGRTFSAGGADVTPVNQNRTASKVTTGLFKTGTPALTLAGTFVESHRWYMQANGVAFEMIVPRANDIILGRANTFEIQFSSANAGGTVLAVAKFFLSTPTHMG